MVHNFRPTCGEAVQPTGWHDAGVSDHAEDAFAAAWRAWHEAREQRLRDPRGWLAVTAIHWLSRAPRRFDDTPGAWSAVPLADAVGATVTLDDGEELTHDGAVLRAGAHYLGPLDEHGTTLASGDAVVEVAERGGRVIVRPRHPDSPHLRAYRGTPCYPPDPAWVLPARYAPYPSPRGEAVGEVVLHRAGSEHRLVAWDGDQGCLWILFRDQTSGVTTYAANRQLLTDPPTPDGHVVLDLNRATNMPCAYTDFATCPVAPATNVLPFAVEAGEQMPLLRP